MAVNTSSPRLRLLDLTWPLALGLCLSALILGQATLYGHAAPFAWALVLVVWGARRSAVGPTLLGAAAGTAWSVSWHPAVLLIAMGLGLLALPGPPWSLALRAALGGLGAVLLILWGWPLDAAVIPMVALAAAVGTSAVLAIAAAFRWLDATAEQERGPVPLSVALYCVAALVSGLEGFHWGGFLPGFTLGTGAVLLAATVGGPAGGALAGATLGVVSVLRATGVLGSVGMLAVAGFVAGWARHRYERAAGVLLVGATVAYAVFLSSPRLFLPELMSMAAAAAVFTLLPTPWIRWLQARTAELAPKDAPRMQDRILDLARVLDEMARLFQTADGHEPSGPAALPAVVGAVCRRCSLYARCWEVSAEASARGVGTLLERARRDAVGPAHVAAELSGRCIKPERIADAVNRVASEQRRLEQRDRLLLDTRQLVRRQLNAMADLVSDMARETVTRRRPPAGAERLAFTVGVAKRARGGGSVSGDTHLVQEVLPGWVAIGLSDGMGAGPEAAWESQAALSLLEEMLRAGFSETLSVRAVNTALLVRDPAERFATLDVMMIDVHQHEAELLKVAAAPTFLVKGGHVEVIRGESLPVGIVETVRVTPLYRTLEAGDLIVMVSDGALGQPDRDGETRMAQYLANLAWPPARPDVMAETLLALMLDSDGGAARDDALVMVIRVDGAPVPVPERVGGQIVEEWRRLTGAPGPRVRRARGEVGDGKA